MGKQTESLAIIELLRREHNHVCRQLAARYPGRFCSGSPEENDEALYQQARLVMGGVFINIILRSYGTQMFGENAADGRGFAELRLPYSGPGVGNHITFNFNLIYRWHTAIPSEWSATSPPPIATDAELRAVFADAVAWRSGGFGPDMFPPALAAPYIRIPQSGIEAARANGAPRLNDFRRRFTNPYKSFEDMCGDPDVAARLAELYPTVEDVELVVGVQVERAMRGGWGLGQTVGTAIIADAFSSIRQDRFYTQDYTRERYTDWGYDHTQHTIIADLLNRHLGMGIDRDTALEKLPGWAAPSWSEVASFDRNGNPIPPPPGKSAPMCELNTRCI